MSPRAAAVLSAREVAAAARVISEEETRRRHVVVSLSGAHAYGFPSPDSDLDVKAVHLDGAAGVLGFPRSAKGVDRLEVLDGVEVDYSSNELGGVLQGVLKGNGNYLERFLSGFHLAGSPWLERLAPLVQASLSQRVLRHYAGFASQQHREWEAGGRRSAKKLLYVLRTTLTGAHLLEAGVMVTDVGELLDEAGLADARTLIEAKRQGEKSELPEALAAEWAARLPSVFARLDAAKAKSALPAEPANEAALEAELVQLRLETLR